jgi:hypothetical protein
MVRPIARIPAPAMLSISVTLAVIVAACENDVTIGRKEEVANTPPSFTAPDAEPTLPPEGGLISYCPTNKCPPGWTTCPSSRFPCDVNVLADPSNCGACGVACAASTGFESFSCAEGRCKMQCNTATDMLDCNGLVEDGCETLKFSDGNCGTCGNACPTGTHCLFQDSARAVIACGCPAGKVDCVGQCDDLSANDSSCGACNNACDGTGGEGAPQYPNMYYGCVDSTCGRLRCIGSFLNCDSKIENGCETPNVTDENCGSCGNACPAGQHCYVTGEDPLVARCLCAGDLTLCNAGMYGGYPKGYCADVGSDDRNCGACGVRCEQGYKCDYGACVLRCNIGYADCNGSEHDGCEIDTRSDPRNCGGCGILCDAVSGQACVAGKCVVEPCDQVDAGEVPR